MLRNFDVIEKTFGLPASLPVTLLIDRKGRIVATHSGAVDTQKFEADLLQLLGESGRWESVRVIQSPLTCEFSYCAPIRLHVQDGARLLADSLARKPMDTSNVAASDCAAR